MRDYKKDLEMCDKATPGPWEWFPEIKYNGDYFEPPSGEPPSVSPPKREEDAYHRAFTVLTNEDAEFIATARETLPYYINKCMEMEKRLLDAGIECGSMQNRIEELEAHNKLMIDALKWLFPKRKTPQQNGA